MEIFTQFYVVDDTYLVVPAECADSRAAELDNIAAWAAKNNLQLNKLKTREVVFHDSRRRVTVSSHRRCCRTSTATLR